MHDRHEPDSGFIDSLEGQLRGELRRRNRFAAAPRRGPSARRLLGMAVLVAVSISLGAAAMGASYRIEESWQRDLLIERFELRLALARQQLEMALDAQRTIEERVRIGTTEPIRAAESELQVSYAEMQVRQLELQLLETQSSGREARDEISSPLVAGRDFVSERLRIEVEQAQRHLEIATRSLQATESRFRVGTADSTEVAAARERVLRVELQLESLATKLRIRQRFLEEEITAEVAELLVLQAEAEERLQSMQQGLEQMRRDIESARTRVEIGTATQADLQQAQLRLLQYDIGLQEAQLELIIVRRELEVRGGR